MSDGRIDLSAMFNDRTFGSITASHVVENEMSFHTPSKREASTSPPSRSPPLHRRKPRAPDSTPLSDAVAATINPTTTTTTTISSNQTPSEFGSALRKSPISKGHDGSTRAPAPQGIMESGGFTKVLSKEEKKKLRKVERNRPQFQFDVQSFRNGRKIGVAHIRDLVLYIVADGQKPSWIIPEHRSNIAHTVMLLIPGLLPEHLGIPPIPLAATLPFPINAAMLVDPPADLPPNRVPALQKMFTYGVPTRAPGDSRRLFSVIGGLLSSPIPDQIRKKREEESKRLAKIATASAASASDETTAADGDNDDVLPFLYLLTPGQMIDNDYKLPSYVSASDDALEGIPLAESATKDLPEEIQTVLHERGRAQIPLEGDIAGSADHVAALPLNGSETDEAGWRETPKAISPPSNRRWPIMAVDCEMVLTEKGTELARVSVIDYKTGKNVYDVLVKPSAKVVDYRTQWSGITAEILSAATRTLADVQSRLLDGPEALLTPYTILLGHSLECDLTAMKIRHALCLDTALMYKHPRGAPYKPGLKWLTSKWLGRDIQSNEAGHDSEEDARACVDLLRLKMANGPEFGHFLETNEPIYERMSRSIVPPATKPKTSAACDYGNLKQGHHSRATTAIRCHDDDEVAHAVSEQVKTHDFVFGRMMQLANVQGWNGDSHAPDVGGSSEQLDKALGELNARLAQIHADLPANTALIIMTGHADPLPLLRLTARRTKWERMLKTLGGVDEIKGEDKWTTEDDRELELRASEAREGMAFFCVK